MVPSNVFALLRERLLQGSTPARLLISSTDAGLGPPALFLFISLQWAAGSSDWSKQGCVDLACVGNAPGDTPVGLGHVPAPCCLEPDPWM